MEAAVGDLMATELRLGLPGTADDDQPQMKATVPSTPRGKKRTTDTDAVEDAAAEEDSKHDVEAAPPVAKAPVVGWPPVRSYRKSCFQASSKQATKDEAPSSNTAASAAANTTIGSFVKVSMDGAPYLRKVDLRMYKGYRELREALEAMFVSSNNGGANLSEFAVTYEDKDGDLMLVGDVPFEMFTSTCKKLRIMKRSEATGLGSLRQ
ncbi:auxin-responsive protein IAA12-like [Phragmites australis]|uniref:auxin-responsive protein IAA12-like n=1 Tax=Phragmites australis TaxID=29695 RepID=UPI002D78ACBF|nr:auxin-responsive protein IAA12-like [Phragmites australis]